MSFRHGRHAPAFVLLALSPGPSYGLAILAFLERSLAGRRFDAASVYRTLQSLERDGAVEVRWERGEGPRRKWYRLTSKGWALLDGYEADVRRRMEDFAFFLEIRGSHPEPRPSRGATGR